MTRLALLALVALSLVFVEACAQGFGRRDRPASPRDTYRESPRATVPDDPFTALERELPSLKVDLKITSQQAGAWSNFERDVRQVADLGREARKRLIGLREADNKPGALELVNRLADEERDKSVATDDLRRHLEVLYSLLDDSQRKTFDRRLWLSQTEPLGR